MYHDLYNIWDPTSSRSQIRWGRNYKKKWKTASRGGTEVDKRDNNPKCLYEAPRPFRLFLFPSLNNHIYENDLSPPPTPPQLLFPKANRAAHRAIDHWEKEALMNSGNLWVHDKKNIQLNLCSLKSDHTLSCWTSSTNPPLTPPLKWPYNAIPRPLPTKVNGGSVHIRASHLNAQQWAGYCPTFNKQNKKDQANNTNS